MPLTPIDDVAYALAYADGRAAALEFRDDHTEEECTKEAEDGSEPAEELISARGAWLVRRWGIDWETQGRAACSEYNRGYRTALLEGGHRRP